MEKIFCLQCGIEMQPRKCGHQKKYCSQKCESKYKWSLKHPPSDPIGKCQYCGNDFTRHNGGKVQKYCSRRCRIHHWRKFSGIEKNKAIAKRGREKDKLNPKKRFSEIKYHAKLRKHEFNLTFKQFITFWNGTCHYCGNKIVGVGIDRLDSNIGYVLGNCVPCCKTCNIMKNTQTVEQFISQCKQIATIQAKFLGLEK